MQLIITEKTEIAADTVRIGLADPGGAALPAFEPGAHIELALGPLMRRYSLTSSPQRLDHYEICVLRTRPSRGGSAYIHEAIKPGETLGVSAPINAFLLNSEAKHSVFIAGGIGVTPFYSMMEALHHAGRSFELHYAARGPDWLLPVPDYGVRATYHTDERDRPRMNVDNLLRTSPVGSDIYVCGPQRLIETVRDSAMERGWRKNAIHFESFGGAVGLDDAPITVTLARSGMTIEIAPGASILDALIAHGVWASYECRRGKCASCVTGFLAGDPDHRDVCLTPDQRRTSLCTCVSWAKGGALTLDL